jgi:hypothetical protein
MPTCAKCELHGATALFRRSPKPGRYLCHDRWECRLRRQLLRRARRLDLPALERELAEARAVKDPAERMLAQVLAGELTARQAARAA